MRFMLTTAYDMDKALYQLTLYYTAPSGEEKYLTRYYAESWEEPLTVLLGELQHSDPETYAQLSAIGHIIHDHQHDGTAAHHQ